MLEKAEKAMAMAGLTPKRASIRGGTDGNNFHSKYEWIVLEDMQKTSKTLVHLLKLWAE